MLHGSDMRPRQETTRIVAIVQVSHVRVHSFTTRATGDVGAAKTRPVKKLAEVFVNPIEMT